MATNIGFRIKERRLELRLTQEELAARMGYKSKSAINKIELGVNDVSQSKVKRFAEVLDVSVAYLMNWHEEPEDLADLAASILQDPQLLVMIEKFRSLTASDQKAVRTMIDALATKND